MYNLSNNDRHNNARNPYTHAYNNKHHHGYYTGQRHPEERQTSRERKQSGGKTNKEERGKGAEKI